MHTPPSGCVNKSSGITLTSTKRDRWRELVLNLDERNKFNWLSLKVYFRMSYEAIENEQLVDAMPAAGIEGSINSGYQITEPENQPRDNVGHYIMTMCSTTHIHSPNTSDVESSQELRQSGGISHSLGSNYSTKSSTSSALRVEIADVDGDDSLHLTTIHLRECKRQVLRPYWKLLMFIGWRGFGREYVNSGGKGWKFLNTLYPIFIILMLIYTYGYEIIACQWKLNVTKDTQQSITTTTPVLPVINHTTSGSFPIFSMGPAIIDVTSKNLSTSQTTVPLACDHIVTTYVVPNVLHFVAFLLGMYHFRVQESEQLYALMESVFLQASNNRSASQKRMLRNMRSSFIVGAIWVLLTLGMQGLYEWAFDFPKLAFFIKTGPVLHWVLFGVELFGILIVNSIFVAVVTNYFTQCEMILFYVKGIAFRLQEKSVDLKTAMKNILSVRHNLSVLNGPIAKMTALVSVIFAELTILGVSILVLNKNNHYKVWLYRSIFPIMWFAIAAIPLMQAARVNSVCNRFKKIALETRVFGYKGSSLLELDSFLNFISHTRLRAKLFHVPILPSYIISLVVLALFIVLILLQTSIIGTDHFV
ncbi:hypothetical protein ACF0H5_020617 [Mactra antiquata]